MLMIGPHWFTFFYDSPECPETVALCEGPCIPLVYAAPAPPLAQAYVLYVLLLVSSAVIRPAGSAASH